ncbi:MAG: MFS transporter [Mailhella sp.]|nr:MFS transporter [Mailhella sp.]
MTERLSFQRRFCLFNGLFAMLCMGAAYAWGVFVIPLENQFGWLRTQTSLAFTLNIMLFALGNIATGILSRRFSFSALMRMGAVFMGGGFFLTSLATQSWQLYFTYSLLGGFGAGLAYNCVVSSVPQWFPERPALMTGILLVGYAMSSAIFGPLCNAVITSYGIAEAFLLIASVSFLGLLLASFGTRVPSSEQKKALPAPLQRTGKSGTDIPSGVMVKTSLFWLTFFVLCFTSGSGMIFINHISPMLTEELGVQAAFAASVISVVFFFNASGRIIGGFFLDKYGMKRTVFSITGLMLFAVSVATAGLHFKITPLLIVSGVCALFAFGANANMIPSLVRELFGQKYFSLNYSLMNLSTVIVSLMPTAIGTLQMYFGGYTIPICGLAGLNVLTILLAAILIRQHERSRS